MNKEKLKGKMGKFLSMSFINPLFKSFKINTFNLIPYHFALLILTKNHGSNKAFCPIGTIIFNMTLLFLTQLFYS